ncbi:hydrogen peroxide-inducible genes activator [Echinicola jeungdonensis]|uniref:Hydrogen peroxide-inducible genes activator n=1 Tax=Echinicola jeungdonensis TaxID=709343 RepID=A0ABV5J765_9BACT|nr:hydrogen peroxide-inducible genes activator [Echinicola jeungdonensis]MDN3669168.1 hydrogen peroxide-inducible genes activator [Echinicola jeungdonensis]
MTIQQLEYVLAVEKHRHFGHAAEACFVTQPTLSAQIHKLEKELDIVIFDRSKMPVIPTEIGTQLIVSARKVVAESKGIYEMISQLKGNISGEIKLGVIPTLAPYLLHLFVQDFLENYPQVQLQVEELITEEIVRRLRNDDLDIGIAVTPLDEQGIAEKPMFYEKFYAYLSKGHPLLEQEKLSINDLEGDDFWILKQGHCFRDQVLKICDQRQFQRMNFHYESGSLEGLRNMVNRYKGVTLLPELATFDLSEEEKSRIRPINGEQPPTREVSLLLSRNFLKKRMVELLYQEITGAVPEDMTSKAHGKIVKFK